MLVLALWSSNSSAQVCNNPIYQAYVYDSNGSVYLPEDVPPEIETPDGCFYRITGKTIDELECYTEEIDSENLPLYCKVEYMNVETPVATPAPATAKTMWDFGVPGAGCAYLSSAVGGVTKFCTYTGEGPTSDPSNSAPTGWYKKDNGAAIPGNEPGDIMTPSAAIIGEEIVTECPTGYVWMRDEEEGPEAPYFCAKISTYGSGGYVPSLFNPNDDTTNGGLGPDPEETPSEGVDICVEHPRILACHDMDDAVDTGPDYSESDYRDAIGDGDLGIDAPAFSPNILPAGDGSCSTVSITAFSQSVTFPPSNVCTAFGTARAVLEWFIYGLTVFALFNLVTERTG